MELPPSKSHILTVTGRHFDYDNIESSDINPLDIAWALAGINRFTGHTNPWYSVAQHSIRVSNMVPKDKALSAFGHDMAEAYTGDINTPLKRKIDDMCGGKFKCLERQVETLVWCRMGIISSIGDSEIKAADYLDYELARDSLILKHDGLFPVMTPIGAFTAFCERWMQLDPTKTRALHEYSKLIQPI